MEHEHEISQELIEEIAELFDIDEDLLKQFDRLQSKISNLKIKFEAHKLSVQNNYGHQRKS
jgi:hypothetical protein